MLHGVVQQFLQAEAEGDGVAEAFEALQRIQDAVDDIADLQHIGSDGHGQVVEVLQLEHHHRYVVRLRSVSGEDHDLVRYGVEEGLDILAGVRAYQLHQPLSPQYLALHVQGSGKAVRIQQNAVPALQPHRLLLVSAVLHEAYGESLPLQELRLAPPSPQQQGRFVSRLGVGEGIVGVVVEAVEEGGESVLRFVEETAKGRVGLVEYGARRVVMPSHLVEDGGQNGHDQRGGHALVGDVADHEAEFVGAELGAQFLAAVLFVRGAVETEARVAGQGDDAEEIATHRRGRHQPGHHAYGRAGHVGRYDGALDAAGHLQLPAQVLLVLPQSLVEAGVLYGHRGHVREGDEQLQVEVVEAPFPGGIGDVQYPDDLSLHPQRHRQGAHHAGIGPREAAVRDHVLKDEGFPVLGHPSGDPLAQRHPELP